MKAVVFDLDDTLFCEEDYVLSGFRAVAEQAKIDFVRLCDLYKANREGVFDRLENDRAKELHQIYINHMPKIDLFPDARICLEQLKESGCKLGLLTDGRVVQQSNKIEALGISKYFDAVVFSDGLGTQFRKPHALPFEVMRKKLGVDFADMVYVGDNPAKDFFCRTLGIETVRILRKGLYCNRPYYGNILPDHIIESLCKLKEVICP